MEHIEDLALSTSTIFWKRYVDDILLADQVDEMLAHIYHNIQFMLEREEGHAISFLDVKMMMALSLHFSSHHPTAHKYAVIPPY